MGIRAYTENIRSVVSFVKTPLGVSVMYSWLQQAFGSSETLPSTVNLPRSHGTNTPNPSGNVSTFFTSTDDADHDMG